MTACPKCQYVRNPNDDPNIPEYQCPECGVIYKKYLAKLSKSFADIPDSTKEKKNEDNINNDFKKPKNKQEDITNESLTKQKEVRDKFCHECGKKINNKAEICPKCGVRQPSFNTGDVDQIGKTRIVAALLALFLGGFGIHKFYLGQTKLGFFYLVFCWTLIPSIIAFIDFIVFLSMTDEIFNQKYGCNQSNNYQENSTESINSFLSLSCTNILKNKAGLLIAIVASCLVIVVFFTIGNTISTSSISSSKPKASLNMFSFGNQFVVFDEYNQIRNGMSYKKVVAIIGVEGEEISRNNIDGIPGVMESIETIMYQWVNSNGSNMNAMFQNDKLIQKAQMGLK